MREVQQNFSEHLAMMFDTERKRLDKKFDQLNEHQAYSQTREENATFFEKREDIKGMEIGRQVATHHSSIGREKTTKLDVKLECELWWTRANMRSIKNSRSRFWGKISEMGFRVVVIVGEEAFSRWGADCNRPGGGTGRYFGENGKVCKESGGISGVSQGGRAMEINSSPMMVVRSGDFSNGFTGGGGLVGSGSNHNEAFFDFHLEDMVNFK